MRLYEILKESLQGTFVHETSPENAEQISQHGFKPSRTGIFFNRDGTNYSGGGYGKSQIIATLNISKLLDLSDDENLPDDLDEFADGNEIADYARLNKYQAWADELQIAVLDLRCINIVKIK